MTQSVSDIIFLRRHQINAIAWDACVLASENPVVYAQSWYLDCVAPNWCALAAVNPAGNYLAVQPVPVNWRFGIGFMYQPAFTQQLGLFALPGIAVTVADMLAALPASVRLVKQNLHTKQQTNSQLSDKYEVVEVVTHELELQKTYPELQRGYKGNLRRSVQKAPGPGFSIQETTNIEPTLELFRKSRGSQVQNLKDRHYRQLQQLTKALQLHKSAQIIEAKENGEVIAGALLIRFAGRLIYLFAGNSERARQTQASARLLDYIIQQNAGSSLLLDFEGGNLPGIGHFFRSFGAVPVPFVSLKLNRLPWPLNKVIK